MSLSIRTIAAPAVFVVVMPGAALAQTASPGAGAAPNPPIGVSPIPNQNTPGEYLRSTSTGPAQPVVGTGLFPSLGNGLLDDGIDFHGTLLDHMTTNPSAGNTPGDIVQTGGVLDGYQTTPIVEASTLTRLTYEQRLLDGRLDLEVGKSNVHQYFFIPNSLDPFTYDAPLLNVNADFNSIPYGLWMGKVTYKLNKAWYLQSAVFEDNYIQAVSYGWTFGDRSPYGVQFIDEFGYRTDFTTELYPANLEAGLVWNTRQGYDNQKGTGVLAKPSTTAADYKGGGVIVLQGAKVVARGPDRHAAGQPAGVRPTGRGTRQAAALQLGRQRRPEPDRWHSLSSSRYPWHPGPLPAPERA